MGRILFAPFSIAGGLLAGLAATKLFEFIWARFDDEEPPDPNSAATRPYGEEDRDRENDDVRYETRTRPQQCGERDRRVQQPPVATAEPPLHRENGE